MIIEPIATILAWVIGVSACVFIPFALFSFIFIVISFYKDYYEEEDTSN